MRKEKEKEAAITRDIPVFYISRGWFRGESRTGRMEGQFQVDDGKRVGSLIQIGEETPEGTEKETSSKGGRRKIGRIGSDKERMERENERLEPSFSLFRRRRKKERGFRALMT